MEVADETNVLGDFGGTTFTHFGVTSTFTRKGGKFFARTDGRLQALNVCWDTRPKESGGQRWFHLYPKEAVPFDDVLHWTGIYQNWNYMCSECHSTRVRCLPPA